MKKAFILAAMVMAAAAASAQTQSGNFMLGGNIGFSSTKEKDKVDNTTTEGPRNTSLYLSPNIGYFIMDGLALGVNINYGRTVSKYEEDRPRGVLERKYTYNAFTFGPMLRYYYMLGDKAAVFAHANAGFGSLSSKEKIGNTTRENPSVKLQTLRVGPGLAYFITPSVAAEATLLYGSDRLKRKQDTGAEISERENGVYFNIGLQVFLGGGGD